jgi:hypothetical protein
MFRDSSNGIEENTTSVINFLNKCIDDIVQTVTIRSTYNISIELKARAAAFKERDTNPDAYKKFRYALRRTIKKNKVSM